MAKEFIIKNAAIMVVEDGTTIFDMPKRDVYYNWRKLENESKIVFYDTNGVNYNSANVFQADLSECIYEGENFTKETFLSFAHGNLGNNEAGESAALKTGAYLIGWQDFADTATTITPIVQTNINGGEVKLTNNNQDTLTDGTTTNNAETTAKGVNDMWSNQSNRLVFGGTGIKKNDIIEARIHVKTNASIIDQAFNVRIDFFDDLIAGNKVFSLRKELHVETLSAGVFREEMVTHDFFIGESILNGSAEIILEGTKSFEVEIIGWNLKIFRIAR
jgi:hypothetical protein